jgi:diguanylate cyclase (GGDEF)-like protein
VELASATIGRLSVVVQFVAVVVCALFFLALSRSIRLTQVRLWAMAWWANALSLSSVFMLVSFSSPPVPPRAALLFYAAGKTAYALLMVAGTRHHLRPGVEVTLKLIPTVVVVAAWSVLLGLFSPNLAFAQLGQYLMVAGLLGFGGVWVLRRPRHARSRWLGVALLCEAVLFAHYVPLLTPLTWGGRPLASYMAYSSFFDAGAEIFLALSILVALEGSTAEHFRHINEELEASQERLRQLVDLDPLTSLTNRRALRDVLEHVRSVGAAIVFFDVDDFKGINDRLGHIAGDDCLKRLARKLPQFFRPDDFLFRWGGDEFLVVAPGLDEDGARKRITDFNAALARTSEDGPVCAVSVGIAMLPVGGEPEEVIHEADRRMYSTKRTNA